MHEHVVEPACCRTAIPLDQVGIAKGIRRIVGLTRGQAEAAQERAKAFEQELEKAEKMDDLALDAAVRRVRPAKLLLYSMQRWTTCGRR